MKRRELEFEVGNQVFLKVFPTKGIVRFDTKGKLSPRYVKLFLIIARIGKLAYHLDLPEAMRGVHDVLYVSILRKFLRDLEQVIPLGSLVIPLGLLGPIQ